MKLEFFDFEFADARKRSMTPAPGLNININLVDVQFDKNIIKIGFTYLVNYQDKSYIRIGGKARFSGPDTKSAFDEWKKTGSISGAQGEQILNAINYNSSINSIFIARVFSLTPPVIPPAIRFKQPEKKK